MSPKLFLIIIVILLVCYYVTWLVNQSIKVSDELTLIENRVINSNRKFELDNILMELNKVDAFTRYHYKKIDNIKNIIKIKHQSLK